MSMSEVSLEGLEVNMYDTASEVSLEELSERVSAVTEEANMYDTASEVSLEELS